LGHPTHIFGEEQSHQVIEKAKERPVIGQNNPNSEHSRVERFEVTGWNNGAHHASGAGYAVKVKAVDRDAYFRRPWGTVTIELPNGVCPVVNIDKDSFWSPSCRELISQDIGRWLLRTGLAPWLRNESPKLLMEPITGNHFRLTVGPGG
jgi:hypothetical protein